ncbi:hypothetical protein BO86DRAFT_19441 [Aspergillus japonicus CBS 114.51]|uniref:Uncharacterized protein n=1 Tax=Aspergillus japonicus CBS 114.51 TaxID=1448312 RepID=A0A8T8WKN0_ASPJA|nr:hypothetical protein BO86DRAFT_19441 [Aspergillus japonicus CBS 114.51]RAH76306.1 hypothetical protein BO86DRAFT_19441 [Aspergillus japonicus CBS 114.51]
MPFSSMPLDRTDRTMSGSMFLRNNRSGTSALLQITDSIHNIPPHTNKQHSLLLLLTWDTIRYQISRTPIPSPWDRVGPRVAQMHPPFTEPCASHKTIRTVQHLGPNSPSQFHSHPPATIAACTVQYCKRMTIEKTHLLDLTLTEVAVIPTYPESEITMCILYAISHRNLHTVQYRGTEYISPPSSPLLFIPLSQYPKSGIIETLPHKPKPNHSQRTKPHVRPSTTFRGSRSHSSHPCNQTPRIACFSNLVQ